MSPSPERLHQLALVAVGGAVGSSIRWAIAEAWTVDAFPWPTLLVNVIGSALLGLFTANDLSTATHRLAAVGFCGGLTTFSTFTVEVVRLLDSGQTATAVSYLFASVVLGLAAFVAIRSIRATRANGSVEK